MELDGEKTGFNDKFQSRASSVFQFLSMKNLCKLFQNMVEWMQ
ncbi:hypothetical protein SORDD27_00279 [Streptococcus oralis]|uniref:Uncharacterized protein n=1 Tax=Streptococcus oralis TaxID=1303 RepID=A0A139Q146_STROR|nr:hypothetical protein SORDD27_00279 [Streptococcus oralis]